jgi:hypothetical protein
MGKSMQRARSLFAIGSLPCVLLGACSGSDFSSAPANEAGSGGTESAGTGSDAAGHAGTPTATEPEGGSRNLGDGGRASDAGENAGGDAPVAGGGMNAAGTGGHSAGSGGIGGSSGVAGNVGVAGGGAAGMPSVLAKASSDFVASGEGWTISGDPITTTPAYAVTGGNPDGVISASDGGTGVWFFTAPAKYHGNCSAFAGGILRFDLKVTAITTSFAYADVQLTTDGLTLAYDIPADPTTSWQRYTVPLTAAGWHVATYDGVAATPADFAKVLANLTNLRIRGEYNSGDDTGYLDNVYLGSK